MQINTFGILPDMNLYLLEASPKRDPILKDIEYIFQKIRSEVNDGNYKPKQLIKDIELKIKKFTGIKKVKFIIELEGYNASVLTIYKDVLNKKVSKKLTHGQFTNVDKLYVFYNLEVFLYCTKKELTALLLHELGHSLKHQVFYKRFIYRLAPNIGLVTFAGLGMFLSALISYFSLIRVGSFVDHYKEYESDKFAAKYGYADDLIRFFDRYDYGQQKKRRELDGTLKKKLFLKLGQILNTSTHPDSYFRICKLVKQMETDYKDMYPYMSKYISEITKDLKC